MAARGPVSEDVEIPSWLKDSLSPLNARPASSDSIVTSFKAIDVAHALLNRLIPGPSRTELLELAAGACYRQYQEMNEWDALETSLGYLGELIEDTDTDDLANSARLAQSYSQSLQCRFMRGRNETDLAEAISFASGAVDRTRLLPESSPILLIERLGTLWLCLFTKVHQLDDSDKEDFDRMIDTAREAESMAKGTENSKHLVETRANLALSYQIKWDREQTYEALICSISLGREVLELLPPDEDADARISELSNLSFRLQRAHLCFIQSGKLPPGMRNCDGEELLAEALSCLNTSISLPGSRKLAAPEYTLTFVMDIRKYPPDRRGPILRLCLDALQKSVGALKELCLTSSGKDQQDSISTFYGICRYAAAAAIQTGKDPYEALLLLEQGRNVMLSSQSERSAATDADILRKNNLSASMTLPEEQNASIQRPNGTEHWARTDQLQRSLARGEILRLAEEKEIIVLNLTDIRSDAIIVSREGLRAIDLPEVDESQLSEASWEIQTRLAQETDQEHVFHELQTKLLELLRDLWKKLTKPILDSLGYTRRPSPSEPWPRVCWIPTGVLCLYPMHATGLGLHREANTMNRVISSYATSLANLHRIKGSARISSEQHIVDPGDVLVVSMTDTPDYPRLQMAPEEIEAIMKLFPNAQTLQHPSTQDVLTALAQSRSIVHFTCHGEVDYDFPQLSRLLTADWKETPLTVSQLQALRLERTRLAFLSACFTANSGVENLQDESIHLAGALQLAGFPNVVGSLWYVGEEAALDVVKLFYERLSQGSGGRAFNVAEALHFATLDFRETTRTAANRSRGNPVLWAPFVHIGL